MLLFGCLLAFAAAFAPRVILVLAALFSERWQLVWRGDWVLPTLGIVFLPYTTVMYMLSVNAVTGNIAGWDWMWIFLGLLLDFWKWSAIFQNRKQVPGYPKSSAPAATASTKPMTPAATPSSPQASTMSAPPPSAPASTMATPPPSAPASTMSSPPSAAPPPASPPESGPPQEPA